MSEKLVEKIIGAAYVVHNDNFFVADVYEGNYYKIMEGNAVKLLAFPKKEYERVLAQYEECVKNDTMITSAYEMNKRANHSFEIPVVTADPEAADKEWYIRKHPQVVPVVEPVKKKFRFFGRKEKEGIGIKCLSCGAVHKEGQKFCGECGAKLPSAEDEIGEGLPVSEDVLEESSQASENATEVFAETDFMEPEEEVHGDNQPEKSAVAQRMDKSLKKPYVKPTIEYRRMEAAEDEEPVKKPAHRKAKPVMEEEDDEMEEVVIRKSKKKKRGGLIVLIVLLVLLFVLGAGAAAYLFLASGGQKMIYDSGNEVQAETVTDVSAESEPAEPVNSGYIVIKLKKDVAMNEQIMEDDLEGTILSEEQYKKYNGISTYIDENGETREELLLFWEDREQVIGKYASRDLDSGSILYDTSITSKHVVADKTFVEVEVDGESNSYEATTDTLPGNTRIQIVAIVKTDGAEPKQVLLSEMTLQDRSLESIFDSAGQDILDMLSEKSQTEEAQTADAEGSGDETAESTEEEGNE